jgi:hypothetical protein
VVARPSLWGGAALFATVAVLALAPAVSAAPPTPILTGTDPVSPNTSLTPSVHGNSTGVIISAIPGVRSAGSGPVARGVGEPTIAVYADKGCEEPPVAEGTAHDLDTVGIPVEVAPESTTFFTVKQSDSTGTSGCSNPIEYQQVKELPPPKEPPPGGGGSGGTPAPGSGTPPPPPHLRTIPAGIANDNTPLVTGSAPGAASVRIFIDPDCSGAAVASGSAPQFADGIPVRVLDNAVVVLYGVSVGPGGARSRCSVPTYYVEDSLAPHTRITMGPAAKTRRHTAIFRFTDVNGDNPGTTFYCKVDHRRWRTCSSPLRLRHLHHHRYTVEVKATDPAGNVETRPARRRFRVIGS